MQPEQGDIAAGYANPLAYHAFKLGANTYVKLVDLARNLPGSGAEAAHADSLSLQPVIQRLALDELAGNVGQLAILPDLEDGHDIGVVEFGRSLGFAQKPLDVTRQEFAAGP